MEIKINNSPEPFSDESFNTDCILAESDVSRLLVNELRRYCRREVNGRSFLIAGHRGSGKTTLVLNSILEIFKTHDNGTFSLRPVLVSLEGASLLPSKGEQTFFPGSSSLNGKPLSDTQNALIQITLALYRSLAGEFTRRFRERALSVNGRHSRDGMKELAASLELELDLDPDSRSLTKFWDEAGYLDCGVLFTKKQVQTNERHDQGYREIVALSTACETYRRISGTFNNMDEQLLKEKKARQELIAQAQGKMMEKILDQLPKVLAGGGGLLTLTGVMHWPMLILGILIFLLGIWLYARGKNNANQNSESRATFFERDMGLDTLDRELPKLISRVNDAGLAPIFVVDELDKVKNLSKRMVYMVSYLKKLVAEKAFFCFLTDRKYYEGINHRLEETPYSVEYTHFSHRLFVVYSHGDLHKFLNRVLVLTSGNNVGAELASEADYPLIPYVLLHDSRMHAIDLRRRLSALRRSDGFLSFAEGEVRDRSHLFSLKIQLTIEYLLDRAEMQARLQQEGDFRRLAYDALYYPSRMWDKGQMELDLGDGDAFVKYLTDMMKSEVEENGDTVHKNTPGLVKTPARFELSQTSQDFLLKLVRSLADLLSLDKEGFDEVLREWDKIRRKRGADPLDRFVYGALPEFPLLQPIHIGEHDEFSHKYEWLYDPYGESTDPDKAAEEESGSLASLNRDLLMIKSCTEFLSRISEEKVDWKKLAERFGLIKTAPAWTQVDAALERLNEAITKEEEYDDFQKDSHAIQDFARLLSNAGETVGLAVLCASAIGTQSGGGGKFGPRFERALRGISDSHSFSGKHAVSDTDKRNTLLKLWMEIREKHSLDAQAPRADLPKLDRSSPEKWINHVGERVEDIKRALAFDEHDFNTARATAWENWNRRLESYNSQQRRLVTPDIHDLIGHTARKSPASLMKYDLEKMTLYEWSRCLFWSLNDVGSEHKLYCPAWMTIPALERLGFVFRGIVEPYQVPGIKANRPLSEEDLNQIDGWLKKLKVEGKQETSAMIIRRRAAGSLVTHWRTSKKNAGLIWTLSEVNGLNVEKRPLSSMKIDWLFIEKPMDGLEDSEERLYRVVSKHLTLKNKSEMDKPILIFPSEPNPKPRYPYVVKPKSLDDLIAKWEIVYRSMESDDHTS